MNVVVFVDGQEETNKLNIMLKSVSLDYDLIITDSFDFLVQTFESKEVSILLAQLGMKKCNALEVFQLARMYNPDIINIAMGKNDCADELVDTFNIENLFKFITMPWLHKNDILDPIKEAFEEMHKNVQHEYDIESLESENVELTSEIAKYAVSNATNDTMFKASKHIFKNLHEQNYAFLKVINQQTNIDFANFIYDLYVDTYYFSIRGIKPLLTELVNKYHKVKDNKKLSIKHTLMKSPEDEIKARIVFSIAVLTEFFSILDRPYDINVMIGINQGHYLVKFQYAIKEDDIQVMKGYCESENYRLLEKYMEKAVAKWNLSFNNDCMEYKIIVA